MRVWIFSLPQKLSLCRVCPAQLCILGEPNSKRQNVQTSLILTPVTKLPSSPTSLAKLGIYKGYASNPFHRFPACCHSHFTDGRKKTQWDLQRWRKFPNILWWSKQAPGIPAQEALLHSLGPSLSGFPCPQQHSLQSQGYPRWWQSDDSFWSKREPGAGVSPHMHIPLFNWIFTETDEVHTKRKLSLREFKQSANT